MDLKETYHDIAKNEMWKMLHVYRRTGDLWRAMKSLYKKSEACVRLEREKKRNTSRSRLTSLKQECIVSIVLYVVKKSINLIQYYIVVFINISIFIILFLLQQIQIIPSYIISSECIINTNK